MKARIKPNNIFIFDNIKEAKNTMNKTWESMRKELKNGVYKYDEIDKAKESTFLSVFDDLFECNKCHELFDTDLHSVFMEYQVVRGAVIKSEGDVINYERLLPKAEHIKEDNRFSPEGVEWLYLALGFPKSNEGNIRAKQCSQAECRASAGDKFAVCKFELNNEISNKIVDLTVGNQREFNKLQNDLERSAERIIRKEVKKYLETLGAPNASAFIPELRKWLVYTYAKMLSEQIFVPVDANDKKLMYAPFHCMAQYFLSLGYSGIIYKSTVFDKGKNLVLFDKGLAKPVGDIEQYTI